MAWLGTNDIRKVHEMIKKGNKKAKIILDAMIYQIAKQIGAMLCFVKRKLFCYYFNWGNC